MTTDEAREAVDVLKLYDEAHSNTEGHRFEAHYDALNAVLDAGVAAGRRQAREAVAAKLADPAVSSSPAVLGVVDALAAIDALGGE